MAMFYQPRLTFKLIKNRSRGSDYYLHFDFGITAGWQAQVHEAVNCLWSRLLYVDQTLVNTHLELLTTLFKYVWTLYYGKSTSTCR